MKTYTWQGGSVSSGLSLVADERLGRVVFLGEEGRGRRYEKVALDKRNPASVAENGRVLEAHLRKVTLPSKKKEGTEFAFWVLEAPSAHDDPEAVLVRVNTSWAYTRGTAGRWETVAGKPETLVSGYGAHGIAGRIGNWDDGIVLMHPGDVLRVKPEGGSKTHTYALWIGANGAPVTATWQDYENLQAKAKAEAVIAEATAEPQGLMMAFGQMPAYTYAGRGEVRTGIEIGKGAAGPAVCLGEEGRGRRRAEVSLIGFEDERVEATAVAILEEKQVPARYYGDKPTVERIYGLVRSAQTEEGALLLRVLPSGGWRTHRRTEPLRGSPTLIARGVIASGTAGYAGSEDDTLWVLRPGDVVVIEGNEKLRVLENKAGKLVTTPWADWEVADGKVDPQTYVAQGKAPWGYVPAEWVGRVVQVVRSVREYDSRSYREHMEYRETHEGELISVSPLVVNLGWDGRDRHDAVVTDGVWVKLDPHKEVRRLDGDALAKRTQIRTEAEALHARAIALTQERYFALAEASLREQVEGLTRELVLDTMPTDGWDSISEWVGKARGILRRFDEATQELVSLEERQSGGEILVDFGGHFRRMGNSGNGDFWVVAADGSLREPDEVQYRKRYTSEGSKRWRTVAPEELALSWDCGTMHDVVGSSSFTVAKAPVGGCTDAQLEAVARIEDELRVPRNAFGLHAEMQKVYDRRMEAIRQACARSRILQSVPDNLEYLTVSGEWGQCVGSDCVRGSIARYVDWGKEFGEQCENRSAQLLDRQPAGDGVLEFLAYEKWGDTNLNIRWRPPREGESGESHDETTADESSAPGKPASLSALEALAAKFGR